MEDNSKLRRSEMSVNFNISRSYGASFDILEMAINIVLLTELKPSRFEILDYLPGRICSRSAGDAATRVRASAAKIKCLDRRAVLRPANHRAKC